MDIFRDNIQEFKKLFKIFTSREGEPCVYCGIYATDKEHVIPKTWIEKMKEMQQLGFNVKIPKELIVPSCKECNCIASDQLFQGIKEKKEFIKNELKRKYKKILLIPLWDDEEMEELEGNLQKQVFFFNEVLKILKKRIEY